MAGPSRKCRSLPANAEAFSESLFSDRDDFQWPFSHSCSMCGSLPVVLPLHLLECGSFWQGLPQMRKSSRNAEAFPVTPSRIATSSGRSSRGAPVMWKPSHGTFSISDFFQQVFSSPARHSSQLRMFTNINNYILNYLLIFPTSNIYL